MIPPMPRFRTVGITVKSELSGKDELLNRILTILRAQEVKVQIDTKRMKGVSCVKGEAAMKGKKPAIDLLIVIGGDGTIFRAIRELGDCLVPILGINRGAIGFLSEVDVDELEEVLPQLLRGHGTVEDRYPLLVEVMRGKKVLFRGRALNEAVIAQGAIARLLNLQTTVRGEPLTTYRADGLIIATPTGSTAYSLSAGGPIVHPRLGALILTPINPHSFSQKPIVLPRGDSIEVEVRQKENKFIDTEVSLTLDGQVYHPLKRLDRVVVRTDTAPVQFLRRKQDTFFSTLRSKLHWGEVIENSDPTRDA